MRRTDGADTIELSVGKPGFRDRNTASGLPGTEVTADWLNDVQEEILGPIEAVGLEPSDDRGQLLKAIRALVPPYAADTGPQNALAINFNRPGWSLIAGAAFRVRVLNSTTDVATINIRNGTANLGTFALVRPGGAPLCPYDLVAGQIVELIYDGLNVQIPRVDGQTGDMVLRLVGTSLASHVPLNGLTIGPSGSGATGRAHPDCRQLYAHLYDGHPDAICPVVGGRGLNAAADWAAGKPIATPNTLCRSLIGVDGMGGAALSGLLAGVAFSVGDAATPGAKGGAARHILVGGEMPPHQHGVSWGANTGNESADHTHAGTTGNESANHTHAGTTNDDSPDHTHSGTTGNESASHTHSGTTGNDSPDHTHSGTTGNESASHTHSGTTGNDSPDHTHSGTTGDDAPDHTHNYGDDHNSGSIQYDPGFTGPSPGTDLTEGQKETDGASVRHRHPFTSGGASVRHQHAFSTGANSGHHQHGFSSDGASVRHQHTFSTGVNSVHHQHGFSSGGASVHHQHAFSTGANSGHHQHTFSSGGASGGHHHYVGGSTSTDGGPGAATPHNNMPPFLAVVMFARL